MVQHNAVHIFPGDQKEVTDYTGISRSLVQRLQSKTSVYSKQFGSKLDLHITMSKLLKGGCQCAANAYYVFIIKLYRPFVKSLHKEIVIYKTDLVII